MARVKKIKIKGFTIIDNDIINDPRMHLKALGLFAYMWSKPDDWQFYISEIATHFKDGESAVSSAMKELMELGYLKRTQNRKDGKFSTYDYVLQEIPKPENHSSVPKGDLPKPEKPKSEKPIPENQGLLITDNTNTDLNNTNITTTTPTNFNNATTAQSGGSQKHSHEDVYNRWQKDWGFPNTFIQEDIERWISAFGNDIVYYTIEYALSKDVKAKKADGFLNTVFNAYSAKKVITVEEAKRANAEFDKQNSNYQKDNYISRKPKKRIYD